MKVYVVMISPDKPPVQQVQMHDEAFEVWFDEQSAYDRVGQLTEYEATKNLEITDQRYYWIDKTTLRITDE